MSVINSLYNYGIVPVVKIDDAGKAVSLAKALSDGGLPCVEITFRTAAGKQAIRNISESTPEILVGAGTVLTTAQVDEALDAGAKFIVAPGLNCDVVEHCTQRGVPVFPGCASPSDIEKALRMGLDAVKFFPAESLGGVDYLKAVSAPYGNVRFMPTGGVNEKNLSSYLALDSVVACGGTWMVKDELINSGKFDEITALAKSAVKAVMGFQFAHIGINTESNDEALKAARKFEILFGFEIKAGSSSVFAGSGINFLSRRDIEKSGYVGIFTNNVIRAKHYLERGGFEFAEDAAETNPSGKPTAIFLKEEIAGFAVRIMQK